MAFHVYRSSAGSGKTYTLVREYLGIVLKDPSSFRHILAVTFTNKAANEMRDRILRSLTEISEAQKYQNSNTVKYMIPDLRKSTGLDDQTIIRNAGNVLSKILHNYQDFAVSTIDSFIHRIIRTFAFDLHLPLNFEVEVDADTMVTQAVDLLLSRVGIEDGPTRALSVFTESRINDEKSWDIEGALKGFSKRLLMDNVVRYLPALQEMDTIEILKVSRTLNGFCRNFEDELSKHAAAMMKFWEENGVGASDLYFGKSGIYGYVNKLKNKNFKILQPGSRVRDTLGDDKWYPDKLEQSRKALVDSLKEQMIDRMTNIIDYIEDNQDTYELYKVLKQNIFPLAVLNEILKVLDQIKENDGVIHISEFDKRISSVVNKEPIPFIYERLGEKYRHFLIDEFQDTSVLEWQNILPLIENALSEAHFNMIVGDEKQAIYRFKGGEVEQLLKLPEIFDKADTPEMNGRETSLIRNYDPHTLQFNYRSREEIIKFNNDFYSFCANLLPESLQQIYNESEQKMPISRPGGEIQFSFVDAEGVKAEKEPVYFERILQLVKELRDNKGYALQDIAILCRSNHEASKIARDLLIHEIEVISAESLLLSSSPEVNFLIFCLDHIANRSDKVAIAGILNYLSTKDTGANLNELLQTCISGTEKDSSSKTLQAYLAKRGLDFNIMELRQMGLYERVESLLRIFSLHDSLDPYIIFFLDVVHEYVMNKRFVPEDFTSYWRDNRQRFSIVIPDGMDAVKVMTIHKAKGLEFPVVIYPFANASVRILNGAEWVPIDDERIPALKTALLPINKSLEKTSFKDIYDHEWEMQQLDLMNIVYVATTRPTERLFLICDMPNETPEGIKDIPGLFRAYLEHIGMWNDAQTVYTLGDPGILAPVEKKIAPTVHPKEFISGNWRDKIVLSGHAAEYWDLEDDARNLEWGNLVHQVLSRVNTVKDLGPAVFAEMNKGNISETKGNELLNWLENMLDKEDLRIFFDGNYQLKNEAGILTAGGKEYRPDRLMIKNGIAIVLDYKTGKEEEKHIRQINAYADLLVDMGYQSVEKYLLYLGEEHRLKKI